mgnify:CR=1 FL=1
MRHSDKLRFMVIVLWLHGYSIGNIGVRISRAIGARYHNDHIWSIIRNSGFKRSRMSPADRQIVLDELKANRLDDGAIKDWVFKVGT